MFCDLFKGVLERMGYVLTVAIQSPQESLTLIRNVNEALISILSLECTQCPPIYWEKCIVSKLLSPIQYKDKKS